MAALIPSVLHAKRLVVKIGSALLVEGRSGRLRDGWLKALAEDVAAIKARGADVILVSSGAIALGRGVLKLPGGALALEQSQAAAAVGQIRLARAYEEYLAPYGITTGQVLVTLEDTTDRRALIGGNFDEVEVGFARHFHGLRGGYHAELLTAGTDQADRADPNLLVDTRAKIPLMRTRIAIGRTNTWISFEPEAFDGGQTSGAGTSWIDRASRSPRRGSAVNDPVGLFSGAV